MAFEIALGRPRKVGVGSVGCISDWNTEYACKSQQVTIIHKSNVLSVTDGLFRESVRSVQRLAENGKYDGVNIEEQIVDSAVYRCVSLIHVVFPHSDK